MSKKVGNVATTTSFTSETAPCRRVVGGVRYRDEDDDGLRVEHVHYACGCQTSRDVFHDGSVTHREVHHNGKSCVATETREKAELYHQQLQGYGLTVTLEPGE